MLPAIAMFGLPECAPQNLEQSCRLLLKDFLKERLFHVFTQLDVFFLCVIVDLLEGFLGTQLGKEHY